MISTPWPVSQKDAHFLEGDIAASSSPLHANDFGEHNRSSSDYLVPETAKATSCTDGSVGKSRKIEYIARISRSMTTLIFWCGRDWMTGQLRPFKEIS
jgi:hypothetical protein